MTTAPALLPFLISFLEVATTLSEADRVLLEEALDQSKPLDQWKDVLDRCLRKEMDHWKQQIAVTKNEISTLEKKRMTEVERIAPMAETILEAHAKALEEKEQAFQTTCVRIERQSEQKAEQRKRGGEIDEMENIRRGLLGK
jgi:exonuclease VII large subunit